MKFTYIYWIQYCSYKKRSLLYPLKTFIIINTHRNLFEYTNALQRYIF